MAFIFFGAALSALIFYVLGIFFKALASAFYTLETSGSLLLAIAGLVLFLDVVLALISDVAIDGVLGVLSLIGGVLLVLAIIGALLGWLGEIIVTVAAAVVGVVFNIISTVLELIAGLCEHGYIKSLSAITRRLEKC